MIRAFTRRLVLAGLLAAPALARAAPAKLSAEDQALVDKAVACLQGLSRVQGRFTQTDSRGKRSVGDIYLQRPGKIRFEYDPPNDAITVISDGNQVEVRNDRLRSNPERYPLRATPLHLFLAKEIRLDRGVVVSRVERSAGQFSITAYDGGRERDGKIVIVFDEAPVALREWTTTDAQGQSVRVQLTGLKSVGSFDPALFRVLAPRPKTAPKAVP
jgi:outer membrane lipoprotein-sorting protein